MPERFSGKMRVVTEEFVLQFASIYGKMQEAAGAKN
jgi:hypothetical protein